MSDIINLLIDNLSPNNIYNNYNYLYNEIYNEMYNIKYDFYNKIIYYINETNKTNDTNEIYDTNGIYDTNYIIDTTSYKINDINYFIFQFILYYVIPMFLTVIFIKKIINKNNPIINDPIINDESKLYFNSLIEITKDNSKIMSQLKVGLNYIVILRIKLKHHLPMKNTKYNLNSKYIKYNYNNTDFSTRDMYMIMGFNHNNQYTHFTHIIVNYLNHLNLISEEKYKNEDFDHRWSWSYRIFFN